MEFTYMYKLKMLLLRYLGVYILKLLAIIIIDIIKGDHKI